MINVGMVDRLLRLVFLHILISFADAALLESLWANRALSIIGFYLLVTMIVGIDPLYKLLSYNSLEDNLNKKTILK